MYIVMSLVTPLLCAEPKPLRASIELGVHGKYYIYINGKLIEQGEGSGSSTTNKHPVPAQFLKRINVMSFKQKNLQGQIGKYMLLSYKIEVKLDNETKVVIRSAEKRDIVLYTDGSKNPPRDIAGKSWMAFEYYPDPKEGWQHKPKYKRASGGLGVKEPLYFKERQPFVLATDDGKSKTANDTYYYRRRFELWGKKVVKIPPTPKPTSTPKPTNTPKPKPTPTPISPTLTPTHTWTYSYTHSYTETYTYSETLEPEVPTYTYSDTPLPTLTLTPYVMDTAVPTEAPTGIPTEQATLPPTYTPTSDLMQVVTPTPVPRHKMLLDFERDYDSYLRTDGYVVLEPSKQGVSHGKRSLSARFKLFSEVNGPDKKKGEWLPSFYLSFDTPKALIQTDWSEYSRLKVEMTNPSETGVNIILEIGDSRGYRYRYKAVGLAGAKMNHVDFDLSELETARLDRAAINYLSFGLDLTGRSSAPTIYIDALRLE